MSANLAADLASAIGGTVYGGDVVIVTAIDSPAVITCTPNGKVMLNREDRHIQLGRVSDGVEHLAAMFFAATSEVTC